MIILAIPYILLCYFAGGYWGRRDKFGHAMATWAFLTAIYFWVCSKFIELP